MPEPTATEPPAHRYNATLANEIERKWQERWETEGTFDAPNPVGDLSDGWDLVADRPKLFVMDMFPYPSGSGLHVGHPLGYIATDVYARFQRMAGDNVLHTLGYDAFGLPAEEYARQTGTHPRATTEANIANMRRQLHALGLGHDPRRSRRHHRRRLLPVDPVDLPADLQLLVRRRRRPGAPGRRADRRARVGRVAPTPEGYAEWSDLDAVDRRRVVDAHRLAYARARRRSTGARRWAPCWPTRRSPPRAAASGATTPSFRRPLTQWTMRITAYADRLLDDLDLLDWTDAIKAMQRNWIGRSEGARLTFTAADAAGERDVPSTCSPPGPTPCSGPPTWCSRPSTR